MKTSGNSDSGVEAPRALRYGFWVWMAAGLLGVVGGVLFFSARETLAAEAVRLNKNPQFTPEQITNTMNSVAWILLLGSIAFALLFGALALKVRAGAKWARTALTVVAVLALIFVYFFAKFTIFGLFSAIVTVVATVLLFLPSSSEYLKQQQ